jgi:hypothetical protein
MKLFDLKIANKDLYGKTHWRTIGTVFAADDGSLIREHESKVDKDGNPAMVPAGFVIDYPQGQGIIVPREKKSTAAEEVIPDVETMIKDQQP